MPDLAIIRAYNELGALAKNIIPSHIAGPGYEPTRDDAKEFVSDLMILANKVDAVIQAYGNYLQAYGIVTSKDVKRYFTDQLLGTLEGNALFAIEDGVEKRIEDRQHV